MFKSTAHNMSNQQLGYAKGKIKSTYAEIFKDKHASVASGFSSSKRDKKKQCIK